jgi:hypothetical protein
MCRPTVNEKSERDENGAGKKQYATELRETDVIVLELKSFVDLQQ